MLFTRLPFPRYGYTMDGHCCTSSPFFFSYFRRESWGKIYISWFVTAFFVVGRLILARFQGGRWKPAPLPRASTGNPFRFLAAGWWTDLLLPSYFILFVCLGLSCFLFTRYFSSLASIFAWIVASSNPSCITSSPFSAGSRVLFVCLLLVRVFWCSVRSWGWSLAYRLA